jgi:hypothetical protein
MAKKSTAIVPTMLRMREELRRRIEREAKKNGRSLNAEMVERLEQSFAMSEQSLRDSAIIDMLVDNNDVSSTLLRQIARELVAKKPSAFRDEAEIKAFMSGMNFAAIAKEMEERARAGEIRDHDPND